MGFEVLDCGIRVLVQSTDLFLEGLLGLSDRGNFTRKSFDITCQLLLVEFAVFFTAIAAFLISLCFSKSTISATQLISKRSNLRVELSNLVGRVGKSLIELLLQARGFVFALLKFLIQSGVVVGQAITLFVADGKVRGQVNNLVLLSTQACLEFVDPGVLFVDLIVLGGKLAFKALDCVT